jgi:hypothetical protein
MELAALAAVSALSVVNPDPEAHRDDISDIADRDDKGKKEKEGDKSIPGSPELPPMHLRQSLSPPPVTPPSSPSPMTSPRRPSTPKPFMEQDDVGTLAFMAGRGFDDNFEGESMKRPIEKKVTEKKQKLSLKVNSHATADSDPMDCSTLVAMAAINSVVESFEPIEKVMVDHATSPTMPTHLITDDASNVNMNNNTIADTVVIKEKALVDEREEAKKLLKEQHRAQMLAQYHLVLREKRLKRSGSAGSIGSSRLSLPSALSLIPESQQQVVPAARGVTDKVSNEFALSTGNNGAAASSNVIGMSASATGVIIVTEEPIKRVSFRDLSLSSSPAAARNGALPVPVSAGESQRLIGRPLPARPLPPIGAADASEGSFPTISPRSGNNRPLPPLNGTGMGNGNSVAYDTMSLQSAGSSTHILHKTVSTNSLPSPDPRYVRGHIHKQMGGAKRKTPPPTVGSRPLSASMSMGISNIGAGRLSPYQAQ